MPRIDPQQLLTCLNVLLSPDGGILSMNEVARLANLMTKFSKKLVSKCIYILILRNTDTELLSAFMGVGGWDLIQLWLQEGIQNKNWALVTELLELLLLTPVDVDRLKSNNLPKIVKGLTKREDLNGIQLLSTQLVQQWLKIVKEVTKKEAVKSEYEDKENAETTEEISDLKNSTVNTIDIAADNATSIDSDANTYTADNGYRLVLRDGKQILCKLGGNDGDDEAVDNINIKHTVNNDTEQSRRSSTSSSSSKHKSSSKSSSSHREKDKSSSNSSSSSSKSRDRDRSSKSSSSSSSRDKDRRNSSHSSSKHRSSSSSSKSKDKDRERRDSKEKQADRDKDTLAKIQPPSLSKVGRIPKKTDNNKPTPPKPSFSVEVRKNSEEKPKTVKIFNSKMRSTGLLDEAKPPPPRNATKKTATNSPQQPPKRLSTASPPREIGNALASGTPPEKKLRPNDPESKAERPGSIKLIAPKPKRYVMSLVDIGASEVLSSRRCPCFVM